MSSNSDSFSDDGHVARRNRDIEYGSILARNELLERQNCDLLSRIKTLEEETRKLPSVLSELDRIMLKHHSLKDRLRETTVHSREQLQALEDEGLQSRATNLLEVKQLKAKIESLEKERLSTTTERDELQRALVNAEKKYRVDVGYIANQDRLLLGSASDFFNVGFTSVEVFREFLNEKQMQVGVPEDRGVEIEALNQKIDIMKKKLRNKRREHVSMMEQCRMGEKHVVMQMRREFRDKTREMDAKISEKDKEVNDLKALIPSKRHLFRFACPLATIDPAPPKKTSHEDEINSEVLELLRSEVVKTEANLAKVIEELDSKKREVAQLEAKNASLEIEKRCVDERAYALSCEIHALRESVDNKSRVVLRAASNKLVRQKDTIRRLESENARLWSSCDKMSHEVHVPVPPPIARETDNWDLSLPFDADPKVRSELDPIMNDSMLSTQYKCDLVVAKLMGMLQRTASKLTTEAKSRRSTERLLEEMTEIVFGYKVTVPLLLRDENMKRTLRDAIVTCKRTSSTCTDSSSQSGCERLARELKSRCCQHRQTIQAISGGRNVKK